ncbi:MAG TPA: type II toxin-antitoxin system death-on-curing family toxin [Acidimicrobiales bacterium]
MTAGAAPVRFLTLEDLLLIAQVAKQGDPGIRDAGLLDSAAHRPQTTLFGEDAYPTLAEKAAALLESIVRNHALVDGNKRTGWLACCSFMELNGRRVEASDDAAFDVVIGIAEGRGDLADTAAALEGWSTPGP